MAEREPVAFMETQYGFVWGAAEVARVAEIDGRVVVRISTAIGQQIEVYVSATGRSLRVFRKGRGELKAVPDGA